MEERKFPKPSQRYRDRRVEQRRFYKAKTDSLSSQVQSKENNDSVKHEQSKVNWVKPTYSPQDNNKVTKENVILTEQNKPSSRQKNNPVKEQKTNYKENERRVPYVPKEKSRHFKASYNGKYQNKTKTASTVPSKVINVTPQQAEVKQDDATVSTGQYLKPAVHVQPIQQHPQEIDDDYSKTNKDQQRVNNFDLVSSDSSLHLQHLLHDNSQEGDTAIILQKETKINRQFGEKYKNTLEQSKSSKEPSNTSFPLETYPPNIDKTEDIHLATVEDNEATTHHNRPRRFRDKLNCTKGGQLECDMNVPLSYCHPSFAPSVHHYQTNKPIVPVPLKQGKPLLHEERLAEDLISKDLKENETTDINQPKEVLNITSLPSEGTISCDLDHPTNVQAPFSDEKYGYRISVDSLFSTSFFAPSQTSQNKCKQVNDSVAFEKQKSDCVTRSEIPVVCDEPCVIDIQENQPGYPFSEAPGFITVDTVISEQNGSFLSTTNTFTSSSMVAPNNKCVEQYDARLVSPKNRSGKLQEPSRFAETKLSTASPHKSDGLLDKASCEFTYVPESVKEQTYTSQNQVPAYKSVSERAELTYSPRSVHSNLAFIPSVENTKTDAPKDACHPMQQRNPISIKQTDNKTDCIKNRSALQTLTNQTYENIPNELEINVYGDKDTSSYTGSTVETTMYKTQEKSLNLKKNEKIFNKDHEDVTPSEDEDPQVRRGTFSQGPYLHNPFFNQSLLTHRAIPSAFVYPSRVGLPGNPSGFTDVAQHSGTGPSPHLFPTPVSTVFLNVGGRLFEVLPSTFVNYPESLLCQIFTGAVSPQVNQRGHIFFDRDGYLFEIILAFARLGQLTLPPRASLTAVMNEAKFFGMYEYMFQQGQIPRDSPIHFQRTTSCTLGFDGANKKSKTKVFVLQGDDKLKIESLKASGSCHLYVDLYTPTGIKETSNFLLYGPEKPDLWKAYQFCAERQLVFHLGNIDHDEALESSKPSVCIVFAQSFVFHGDEFIP